MSRLQACIGLVAILLVLFSPTGGFASELATLTGYVTDPSGLRIPQSRVQVTNIETNVSYAGETNDVGLYRVSNLPPGQYRLIIQKNGFKTVVKQDIDLHVQDGTIVIASARGVRQGWLEAAERAHAAGDDEPIGVDVGTHFDEREWRW